MGNKKERFRIGIMVFIIVIIFLGMLEFLQKGGIYGD